MVSVKPRLENEESDLESAQLGQEMHSLVHVDTNFPLVAVVPSHGKYLQFKVNSSSSNHIDSLEELGSHKDLSFIPPINARNRKDSLYNRVIQFFNDMVVGGGFLNEEMPLCKTLVKCVRDIFWYLDGHHYIFERISKPISSSFNCFSGYNVPELSKHRKRLTRNLSSDQLRSLLIDLSSILLESYWDRTGWIDIKKLFLDLSESLSAYFDYLIEKNKKVKANHRSPTPVRELPENLHLKFLASSDEPVPTPLKAIDELLQSLISACQ